MSVSVAGWDGLVVVVGMGWGSGWGSGEGEGDGDGAERSAAERKRGVR